jgi:hypothetical protein
MNEYKFNYYYGHEAGQYSFYRIPKALFTDEAFSGLSCEAKVLYGLMLDRMGLSVKNNWVDEDNRVYIYFTLEDAMEAMRCGQDKGVKLFAELDDVKGIGLIERKKQGMGRPARIYVKSFVINDNPEPKNGNIEPDDKEAAPPEVKTSEKPKSSPRKNRSQDLGKVEVKTSEKPKSLPPENRSHDFGKTEGNYNNINNTEYSDTDVSENKYNDTDYPSIYQSSNPSIKLPRSLNDPNDASPYEVYRQILKDNIDYGCLVQDGYRKEDLDEIIELMLEAVCSAKKHLRINGDNIPAEAVKSRFLKLDYTHIQYALDCMEKNTTKVHNIRSYLLTTLYNSLTTISHYYKAEVNHDLYGKT